MADNRSPDGPAVDPQAAAELRSRHAEYWRRNIRYVAVLLAVWFTVSYGFGILLVEPLNRLSLPGTEFPLGFWFAQQGSIYVFVVLIFVYVWLMNRLDREFDVDEGDVVAPAGRDHGAGGRSGARHARGPGHAREADRKDRRGGP